MSSKVLGNIMSNILPRCKFQKAKMLQILEILKIQNVTYHLKKP